LYLLGNLRCENHNYEVAHALYTRALAAAEKVAPLEDKGRSLVAQIQRNQQAVSEILKGGESRVEQATAQRNPNFFCPMSGWRLRTNHC
jgi:hypothetical protein